MLKVDQIYLKRFFLNNEVVDEVIAKDKSYRIYYLDNKSILVVTIKSINLEPCLKVILKKFKKTTRFLHYEHKILNNRNIYIMSYGRNS
jgi:hypothetical protein